MPFAARTRRCMRSALRRATAAPAPPQERHARGLRHGAALSPRRLERAPAALSGDGADDATDDAAERLARRVPGDAHVYERHRRGHHGRRGRREGPPRDRGRRAARGGVCLAGHAQLVDGRRFEKSGGRGAYLHANAQREQTLYCIDALRDKLEDATQLLAEACLLGPDLEAAGAMDEVREGMELAFLGRDAGRARPREHPRRGLRFITSGRAFIMPARPSSTRCPRRRSRTLEP